MATDTINSKTVEGLLEFCDYLLKRGYAGESQVNPWKIAIRQVFTTVDGEGAGSVDVATLDLDDYLSRFEVKARGDYSHGSLQAYVRRVRKAIEAYSYFLENNRPPTFRKGTPRPMASTLAKDTDAAEVKRLTPRAPNAGANGITNGGGGLIDFPFPLRSGQMAHLHLPPRLNKEDADRLSAFLRTLQFEEQGQLPPGDAA
jgi:hypothetical protein